MVKTGKPLRVLHLLSYLGHGGIETWLMEMVRKSDRGEIAIDVCQTSSRMGSYEDEFKRLGGKVYRCPLRKNMFGFARDLRQILRDGQYDIFHSHHYFASGYFLRIASKVPGLKLVAHLHPTADIEPRRRCFPRPLFRWLMRRWIDRYADAILGASLATLDVCWGENWRDNPRVVFQPNGIDISAYEQQVDPDKIRKELGLPQTSRIALTVGRYTPYKNQIIIPDIAARICREYTDVYFVLIGVGPLREKVVNRVKEMGLEERFQFLSGLPSMIPFWKSSDVFLFPSLMEGFGIVVIEAAAAGLPVVACRVPGVIEAAAACHNATLMDIHASCQDWTEAVEKALKASRLVGEEYESFKEKFQFTTQNSLDTLLGVYKQITGGNQNS